MTIHSMMTRVLPSLATAGAMLMLGAAGAEAQIANRTRVAAELMTRELALVVMSASSSQGAATIIRRGVGAARTDVIVLPADADARQLLAGVSMLRRVRAREGDRVNRQAMYRVHGRSAPATAALANGRDGERAQRALAKLRGSTPRDVDGLGTVRSLELYLPRTASR